MSILLPTCAFIKSAWIFIARDKNRLTQFPYDTSAEIKKTQGKLASVLNITCMAIYDPPVLSCCAKQTLILSHK